MAVNAQPLKLEGQFWQCVLMRSIRGIAAVGPTTVQVIELLAETREQAAAMRAVYDDPDTNARGLDQEDYGNTVQAGRTGGITWID